VATGLSVDLKPRRWRPMVLDVAAVVLFVVIGRASHHHGETVGGVASTTWPFAVGLGAGWVLVVAAARRRPGRTSLASLRGGVVICVTTVVVGMTLRVAAGQGTAAAFVAVATGFLGAVMLAGRAALGVAARHAARRRSG